MTQVEYTVLCPFGGSGGGALGFLGAEVRLLGHVGRFRCLGSIDFDAGACEDFRRFTASDAWHVDVEAVTAAQLVERYGAKAPDVVFMSPPCLPSAGLVLTPTGPRRIDSIRAEDLVLSHTGAYRRVLKVGTHVYTGQMNAFRLNGTVDEQEFTDEHPLWIRRDHKPVIDGRQQKRRGPARFVQAKDVRVGDRVGFPIDRERAGTASSFVASLGDPTLVTKGGKSTGRYAKPEHEAKAGRVVDLRPHRDSFALWFLIGAYLGDGYRRASRHEVIFCVGPSDGELARSVRQKLATLGIEGVHEDDHGGRGNVKLRVHAKHLSLICGAFGDGAAEKRIPHELMSLERPLLDALVEGYRATDGSARSASIVRGKKCPASWKIVSVSLPLLRDVQRLLLRRGEFGAIHVAWAGGAQTIMGRQVQTRPRWEVKVTKGERRGTYDFDDDVVWVRVKSKTTRATSERVWNLEVDVDNTFCVPMMATHNCKGSSRLLSSAKAATAKYVAMNRLALVWTRTMLAAWGDSPPALVLLENVPGLPTRAASMLRELRAMLKRAGYVFHASTHDCGEIGGLAQHRQRYLLVARHPKKCPSLLYQPPVKRVRGVGEVLGELPMPATVGAQRWGALHTMPRLSWRNWLRLALIPAGGDWRDLEGVLAKGQARREVFRRHPVQAWDAAAPAITGPGGHSLEGIADPRVTCTPRAGAYGVTGWDDASSTVIGSGSIDNARQAVADPRVAMNARPGNWSTFGVSAWDEPSATVAGESAPSNGRYSVADPRVDLSLAPSENRHWNKLDVLDWTDPAPTVIGKEGPSNGGPSVADPRVSVGFDAAYAVLGWGQPARTIAGTPSVGCGAYSVADPRDRELVDARVMTLDEALVLDLDASKPPLFTPVIVAADGTWHRPLTLLELSALQGYPTDIDGQPIAWSGGRTVIAEHVGNSVPPPAARAIAERMLVALVEASAGAMSLSSGAVWVRPTVREARA